VSNKRVGYRLELSLEMPDAAAPPPQASYVARPATYE
jgi:hypothetical protein